MGSHLDPGVPTTTGVPPGHALARVRRRRARRRRRRRHARQHAGAGRRTITIFFVSQCDRLLGDRHGDGGGEVIERPSDRFNVEEKEEEELEEEKCA